MASGIRTIPRDDGDLETNIEKLINNISNIFDKGENTKQWSRYSFFFFFFFTQNVAETTGHHIGKNNL